MMVGQQRTGKETVSTTRVNMKKAAEAEKMSLPFFLCSLPLTEPLSGRMGGVFGCSLGRTSRGYGKRQKEGGKC